MPREVGTPNRITADVREMISRALYHAGQDCGGRGRRAGVQYLRKQAHDNPKAFLSLVGKIVPAEIVTNGAPILLERIVMLALERRADDAEVIDGTALPAPDDTETTPDAG